MALAAAAEAVFAEDFAGRILPFEATAAARYAEIVVAEHLIRPLFLLLGHRVVEIVERRDQLLQMLGMRRGNLLIGLHILNRVHRRVLLSALCERLIHVAGVVAHHLGELIPLRLLGRGDAQLSM